MTDVKNREPFVYAGSRTMNASTLAEEQARVWAAPGRIDGIKRVRIPFEAVYDVSEEEFLAVLAADHGFDPTLPIAVTENPGLAVYFFAQPREWADECWLAAIERARRDPVFPSMEDTAGIERHGECHVPWPDEVAAARVADAGRPKDLSGDAARNVAAAFRT